MNEDYTFGVLTGIPIFCVNRVYKRINVPFVFTKEQYIFKFENGYSVSIVEFVNREMSGGHQYEMLMEVPGNKDDVELGGARDMHKLLCEIEEISRTTDIKCIDNEV